MKRLSYIGKKIAPMFALLCLAFFITDCVKTCDRYFNEEKEERQIEYQLKRLRIQKEGDRRWEAENAREM